MEYKFPWKVLGIFRSGWIARASNRATHLLELLSYRYFSTGSYMKLFRTESSFS